MTDTPPHLKTTPVNSIREMSSAELWELAGMINKLQQEEKEKFEDEFLDIPDDKPEYDPEFQEDAWAIATTQKDLILELQDEISDLKRGIEYFKVENDKLHNFLKDFKRGIGSLERELERDYARFLDKKS